MKRYKVEALWDSKLQSSTNRHMRNNYNDNGVYEVEFELDNFLVDVKAVVVNSEVDCFEVFQVHSWDDYEGWEKIQCPVIIENIKRQLTHNQVWLEVESKCL